MDGMDDTKGRVLWSWLVSSGSVVLAAALSACGCTSCKQRRAWVEESQDTKTDERGGETLDVWHIVTLAELLQGRRGGKGRRPAKGLAPAWRVLVRRQTRHGLVPDQSGVWRRATCHRL